MPSSKPKQILEIDPPETITFQGPFSEVVTSNLKLRNPSDDQVAFKVKTTAPKRYCVRPNSGSIKKDEEVTVSVMLQPFDFDPSEKTKHKFMIQSIVLKNGVSESDVWKDADPEMLMDTKLRVNFELNEQPAGKAEEAAAGDARKDEEVKEDNVTSSPKKQQPVAQSSSPTQNNLDSSPSHTKMSASKANVKPTGSDDDYHKMREDNQKMQREITSLKEEAARLRRIAMSDTMSQRQSSGSQQQTSDELPKGIKLLLHDTTNIVLIVLLILSAFAAGFLLAGAVF